jgi:hypothetical protein
MLPCLLLPVPPRGAAPRLPAARRPAAGPARTQFLPGRLAVGNPSASPPFYQPRSPLVVLVGEPRGRACPPGRAARSTSPLNSQRTQPPQRWAEANGRKDTRGNPRSNEPRSPTSTLLPKTPAADGPRRPGRPPFRPGVSCLVEWSPIGRLLPSRPTGTPKRHDTALRAARQRKTDKPKAESTGGGDWTLTPWPDARPLCDVL